MGTLLIAVGALIGYLIAYHTYGKWLAGKIFRLEPDATVPSVELNDDRAGSWIWLTDDADRRLPIRFMPLVSSHAPHMKGIRFAPGKLTEPWDCLDGKRLRHLEQGQVFTFLIDLMSDDLERVEFRIYHQDSSSSAPDGFPPVEVIEEAPVDLAVLCMPSYWLVDAVYSLSFQLTE